MKEGQQTIDQIRELCQRSLSEGEFSYDHNEELDKYCTVLLGNSKFDCWGPLLFKVIEEFDEEVDLTLGSPGPLVHTLESFAPKYEEYLLESLARKPTGIAVWMAERISRSPGKDKTFWLAKLEDVLSHPNATASAREGVEDAKSLD